MSDCQNIHWKCGDNVEVFGCTLFPLKGIIKRSVDAQCCMVEIVDGYGETINRHGFKLNGCTIKVHKNNLRIN